MPSSKASAPPPKPVRSDWQAARSNSKTGRNRPSATGIGRPLATAHEKTCAATPAAAVGHLTVDLGAIAENYRILKGKLDGCECGAAVKANAYGLGLVPTAEKLFASGCRTFFVANLDEGIALRERVTEAEIHVLGGLEDGLEAEYAAHGLIPVLNSLSEIECWRSCAERAGRELQADIHLDTGFSRLGLPTAESNRLACEPERLRGIGVRLVMSHLACGDDPNDPMSARQLAEFRRLRETLPMGGASLANSAGVFLGRKYHFDLARPGIALYGGSPVAGQASPMRPVVRLQAPILQVRDLEPGATIGYGATCCVERPMRVATLAIGYADGYPRSLGNKGLGYIEGFPVPVVGRISMDLTTMNVTDVPVELLVRGTLIDLIGPNNPIDEVARRASTIANELLIGLGSRLRRRYIVVGEECSDT